MSLLKLTPLALAVVLAGCTMAPTYERPEAPVEQSWPQGDAYKDVKTTQEALPSWDRFFTNDKLKQVIGVALANNRDLRVALLNVEKARATYGIQRADLMPNVSGGFTPSHSKTPGTLSTNGAGYISHTYQANLASTAWELDLFGRVRSLTEAALETYFATEEASYGTQNALIAEVANAWVSVGAAKDLLALSQTTLKSQEDSYRLMEQSYRFGASSALELEQAKTTVASARASLASSERTLAQARNALTLLVGAPIDAALEPEKLVEATNYGAIAPAGLPSEVLLRRPDIRQAENSLKAANANIGAARANFFPRISLTASIGTGSTELSDLFHGGSGLWSFVPTVSLPIFTGGANISTLRQAEASQKIAVATYEKTIQNAFAEVSDALAAEGTVSREAKAQYDLMKATEKAYSLSQERYRNGMDSFLTVLDSQRQMVAAQSAYIAAEQSRMTSLVLLYKVLGGGAPAREEDQTTKIAQGS